MRDFRKLIVYKEALQLSSEIFELGKTLPKVEKYGIVSQINRAAVSIVANIAEGCSRSSDKEFVRFIEIALGSSFEVEALIDILILRNYFNKNHVIELTKELTIIQKKLNALRTKVKSRIDLK